MKIIKSLILDGSEFGEGKGGAKEIVCFGLLRMSQSCDLSINQLIISQVKFKIADVWRASDRGLFLAGGRDKYAHFHVIGFFRQPKRKN
jgi:hypothetical protein